MATQQHTEIKKPRPKKPANKRRLTPLYITRKNLEPGLTWDTEQKGLVLCTQKSGHKSFKCIYSHHGRPRWFAIADANAIGLSDARKHARRIMNAVAEGRDPQAERKAERAAGSFEELAGRYVSEYASKHNKSWRQAAALVNRYCLPKWGKLKPTDIARADVKSLMAQIEAPILGNQILASVSAVFSWAVRQEIVAANPCKLIDRNATRSRERVLSDLEVPLFWAAFDEAGLEGKALKTILVSGQRPGEVSHMRHEHIVDGWWQMPGAPDPKVGWPGTKNAHSHRVWLPAPAREIIAELGKEASGFVFASERGGAIGGLANAMRVICAKLKVERATPHDLRRTHGTTITSLGFTRDAMNRIQNHKEGGIGSVYDRHGYAKENQNIMEATAARIMALLESRSTTDTVVALRKSKKSVMTTQKHA